MAAECNRARYRALAAELAIPARWAMGNPEVARSFGDLSAVPTLFLCDGEGRRMGTFYGSRRAFTRKPQPSSPRPSPASRHHSVLQGHAGRATFP